MLLLTEERPLGVRLASQPGVHGAFQPAVESVSAADTASEPFVPIHPLGIKPLGNLYFHRGPVARDSMGIWRTLPDELLVRLLEYLDPQTLRRLGYTCRFLFAHNMSEELWKTLFLESNLSKKKSLVWLGSWRATLLHLPRDREAHMECSNVFSDVLHRPFVCSHIDIDRYAANIPPQNQIDRFEDLTYDEFAGTWSNKPFVLTKSIHQWPVVRSWNLDKLLGRYGDVDFRAENVDWTLRTFHDYISASADESPLYLFDKEFAEKMGLKLGSDEPDAAYWKPACFGPDLFEVLGPNRPAHRWLIIGPKRSGSTFHKDPNATSAWNGVIEGAKYWIMFPPNVTVPGVYVSADSAEVTSPLSIAEWLLEFHAEARKLPQCREGVCKAGEILHVPSGWWHLVVNLDAGIALTQNFVPKSHLTEVLLFLKDRPKQVTGFKKEVIDPYGLFVDRLRETYPHLLAQGLGEMERQYARKKRVWDLAVGEKKGKDEDGSGKKMASGFSFGFGIEDEDEEQDDEIP